MFLMKLSYPSCWRPEADKMNMGWVNWSSSVKTRGKQAVEKGWIRRANFELGSCDWAGVLLCWAGCCVAASQRSPSPVWSSLTATRRRTRRLGRRSSRPWPAPSCRPWSRTCGPVPCPSWPAWSATTPWWPWLSSAVRTQLLRRALCCYSQQLGLKSHDVAVASGWLWWIFVWRWNCV